MNAIASTDHITPLVESESTPDFSQVQTPARVAVYDDLRSAPRITEIEPGETSRYIESLASCVYEQAKQQGGSLPYTVIREVTENFIHAYFREVIVSILDDGNTIRFADQGPGISDAEKAQKPGFTSAIEPMKHYIRGVGSGLPIVKDYLDSLNGTITVESNINDGAVVTISNKERSRSNTSSSSLPLRTTHDTGMERKGLHQDGRGISDRYRDYEMTQAQMAIAPLSARERMFLAFLYKEEPIGVTALAQITDTPASSTHVVLQKLEEAGLVEKVAGKKRALTPLGHVCAENLLS